MPATLKVSSRSAPNAVAGALAGIIEVEGRVEIQVVGAGALNQAVKAVAIARGFGARAGWDLSCRPTFSEVEIDGQVRTAIRLEVRCEHTAPEVAAGDDGTGAGAVRPAPDVTALPVAAEPRDDVVGVPGTRLRSAARTRPTPTGPLGRSRPEL